MYLYYFTGIDPGGPCYTYQPASMKLNRNDALSVQILHCSGGVLGVPPSYTVGADFYYYGGIYQPACRNISCKLSELFQTLKFH